MITSTLPTVTIVTPTIPGREKVLLDRCIPSVQNQEYSGRVEHLLISDENMGLAETLWLMGNPVRLIQINDTWKNDDTRLANGALPWMLGSRLALGDYVGFLGDDDELKPDHVSLHVQAMQQAGALWSLSRVDFFANNVYWSTIGDESYAE